MFERFDRSMRLFSASWSVLKEDKTLAVYPLVSSVTALIVIASFALPIVTTFGHVTHTVGPMGEDKLGVHLDAMGWVLAGIGYFCVIYIGIFCNAALVVATNERLTGTGPGTLASGFSGAAAKAGAFVPWALLSATVTLALRAI
jgi:hypothetical protein